MHHLGVRRKMRCMKSSRTIQFAAAAILFSLGCGVLLANPESGFALILGCLASFSLFRRSDWSQSVSVREVWIAIFGGAGVVAIAVLANRYFPQLLSAHFGARSIVVGVVWAIGIATLFWRWNRETNLTSAEPCGSDD